MKKFKMLLGLAGMIIVLAIATGCKNNVDNNRGTSEPGVTNQTGVIKGKVSYLNSTDCSNILVSIEKTDGIITQTVNELAQIKDYEKIQSVRSLVARSALTNKTADKDGNYCFNNLEPGTYTIYASSNISKEKAVTTNVVVKANSTVTAAELNLTATGSISGKVIIDENATGNAGFIVCISGTSYLAATADDGSFIISDVPAEQDYSLIVLYGTYSYFVESSVKPIPGNNVRITDVKLTMKEIKEKMLNGDNGTGEKKTSYVTMNVTDKGIEFSGSILNNSHSQTEYNPSNFNKTTSASATITIRDNNNKVEMVYDFIKIYYWSDNWKLVYPLVEKGKKYNFTVRASYGDWTIYEEDFIVTAKGGLGEYKIENTKNYGVELTKDKVLRRTGKAVYTDNPNVRILREGIVYSVSRKEDNAWIIGDEAYPEWLDVSDGTRDLKNAISYQGWQSYESINTKLSGFNYEVFSYTKIQISGWTYDGNVYFKMNDYVETNGFWGGNKTKKLVTYGLGIVSRDGDIKINTSTSENKYNAWRSETDITKVLNDNQLLLSNMPGTAKTVIIESGRGKDVTYPYTKLIEDLTEFVYEPEEIPVLTVEGKERKLNFVFRGWRIGTSWSNNDGKYTDDYKFPYKEYLSGYQDTYSVDGEIIYSVPLYAIFELVPSVRTAKFMMNDGTDNVYTTLVSQPGDLNFGHFEIPKEPVREGYVFKQWYYYREDNEEDKNEGSEKGYETGKDNIVYYDYDITENDNVINYDYKTIYSGGYFASDVIVYAEWSKILTATLMDGNKKLGEKKFIEGSNSLKIIPDEKEGYVFDGWYLDEEFTIPFTNSVSNDVTVYVHWVKAELLFTNINSNSLTIDSQLLSGVDVGDTLYFEIYRITNDYPAMSDAVSYEAKNELYIDAYIDINETRIVKRTFTSDDYTFIQTIKTKGLYVEVPWSKDVCIKNIWYVNGPSINVSIYNGEKLLQILKVAPNTDITVSNTLFHEDGFILDGLYTDSELKNPWNYNTEKDINVYAKLIEAEELWKGSTNEMYLSSWNVDFSKLAVGDSLYFIINNDWDWSDRRVSIIMGEKTKIIYFGINSYETKLVKYTFTSSDSNFIEIIKESGMNLRTNAGNFIQILYTKGN